MALSMLHCVRVEDEVSRWVGIRKSEETARLGNELSVGIEIGTGWVFTEMSIALRRCVAVLGSSEEKG